MGRNPQLEVRTGLNRPTFLGEVQATELKTFKVLQADTVLMEGQKDVLPKFSGVVIGESFAQLYNSSGGVVDFDLVLRDQFGSERVLDSASVGNGSTGDLNPPSTLLAEGQKLILRSTAGSFLAGNGVRCIRATTRVVPNAFRTDSFKVLNPTVEVAPPPGTVAVLGAIQLFNFSSENIPYTVYSVFEDGFEFTQLSGTMLANNQASIGFEVSESIKYKFVLASLPASGYVLALRGLHNILNAFSAEPPL